MCDLCYNKYRKHIVYFRITVDAPNNFFRSHFIEYSPLRTRRLNFRFLEIDFFYRNIIQFANRTIARGSKRKEEWTGKLNGRKGWNGDDRWLCDRGGWEVSSIRAVRSWASFCPGFLLHAERFKGPAYSQIWKLAGFLRKSNIFNGIFLRSSASRSWVKEKKKSERGITFWPMQHKFRHNSSRRLYSLKNSFFIHTAFVISVHFSNY